MIQSHDNDRLNIFLCDFQLRTKKFHYLFHIHCVISRDLAQHELTQDKIYCRIVYRIAVTQRLQPCPHLIYRMNMTIKNLLLQWPCHFLDIFDWWCYEWHNLYTFVYFISSTTLPTYPSMLEMEDCETIRCKYLSSY